MAATGVDADPAPDADHGSGYEAGGQYEPGGGMAGPLIGGAFVTLLLAIANPPHAAEPAAFVGAAAAPAIIVGLVLYFAFGRRRDPGGAWKIPVILLPVAFVGALLAGVTGAAGERNASLRNAADTIADAGQRLVDSDGRDPSALKHSGATGEAGELERVSLDFWRQLMQDRADYERDMNASGFTELLAPAQMRRPSDVAPAKRKVIAARALVRRYRTLFATRIANLPHQFEQADLGADVRQGALEGIQRRLGEVGGNADQLWQMESDIVEAIGRAVDVLGRGGWTRRGGNFAFSRPADLREFNALLAEISRISGEQERLTAARRQSVRDDLRARP